MAQSAVEFRARDDDSLDDLRDAAFVSRGCCCFNFPCFRSRQSGNWERIPPSAGENEVISRSWWHKGMDALKTARGWSELVAGPRWKTFIRRFNRTGGRPRTAKFQYDPLSYSLNFDHGWGQNGEFEGGNFSSRFSAIPAQNAQIHGGT